MLHELYLEHQEISILAMLVKESIDQMDAQWGRSLKRTDDERPDVIRKMQYARHSLDKILEKIEAHNPDLNHL